MKNISKLPAFLFLAILAIAACKKEDEKTPEELLMSTTCWKIEKQELFNATTSTWTNEPVQSCDQDDCFNFKTGGVLEITDGAVKCSPSDPAVITGSWSIESDGKSMTINQGGLPQVGTIIELSESKFVFEFEFSGIKGRFTFSN